MRVVLLILSMCCVALAHAQLSVEPESASTAGVRIAFVDTIKLLSSAPQKTALDEKLRAESRKMQDTLSQLRAELSTLKAKMNVEQDETKKNQLRQQLLDRETLITRRTNVIQETFILKQNDGFAEFQEEVTEVIMAVAQEKGLNAVLPNSSAVYVGPKVDITDDVMKALKKRFEETQNQSAEEDSDE